MRVVVLPKKELLDPQGEAIQRALHTLGFSEIRSVRVGKCIEVEFAQGNKEECHRRLQQACQELLVNPIIEEYVLEEPIAQA
ncbi:phosphoribosylformylglycinamidine synthase subunit PurS [Candidatus Methylacidithermus pantelleriae]|uniref:Phosphoribosylformylglycinamidine synthase subunit PurS n=1 Tax=Candidatus Methylacidithermus pantelleriae TaxID=2744239 RepID=A0A8J2BIY3_9BACT|nr:phosphoribosylformylglycinamidine synthase subunit PurS [Candidatus Methylacidithermus pantelleriae]CAF0698801.1 Phosphoribosylformylglycinamidine synthase subunit PurS [Candidatus Methylacidithermus pantelleriae]